MRARSRQWHQGAEEGFTLMELAISLVLVSILLFITAVVFNTYREVDQDTAASNTEINQLVPVGTSFQRLLRTAVSPATAGAGNAPISPFGIYKTTHALTTATPIATTSLTFFSNTGTSHGPVKVTAVFSKGTFTVTTTAPDPGTCPHTVGPSPDRCAWTGKPSVLLSVSDVYNKKLNKPVFSYYLNFPMSTKYGSPAPTSAFATCTPPVTTDATPSKPVSVTHCPAANINSVKVDLEVKAGNSRIGKLESQTVTYQLSSTSQAYSAAVG